MYGMHGMRLQGVNVRTSIKTNVHAGANGNNKSRFWVADLKERNTPTDLGWSKKLDSGDNYRENDVLYNALHNYLLIYA